MKITVKLYASLTCYLPEEAVDHAINLDITEQDSPHAILRQFSVPIEKVHIVLINGLFVEPDKRTEAIFKEGDVLACWPPVAGG